MASGWQAGKDGQMRAAVITEHGDISVFASREVPDPAPGPGEVLVRLKTAALNHLDIWLRKGRPGLDFSFPHIVGSDGAGEIVAVGEGVSDRAVGDAVLLNPGLACNKCEYCLRGEHSECPAFTIVGMGCPGTYAEYVAVPAINAYPKPDCLNWEEAAALPLAYLTAWRMLFSRARIQAGETVLIHGIGGGVALAALQLATAAGARAVVTSSDPAKLDRARRLGADEGIDYRKTGDVAAAVLEWSDGRGVDVVVDTVGAQTWPVNLAAARKGGRIVHCGVTTGATTEANLGAIYWRQLSVLGSTMGTHEEFRRLLALVASSGIRPVIDKVYPLAEAAAAQARMEAGEQFGKIVLSV